jgi:hypothetical protein
VLCLLASSPSQGRSTLIVLIALRESLKLLVAVTLVDLVTLCYYSYSRYCYSYYYPYCPFRSPTVIRIGRATRCIICICIYILYTTYNVYAILCLMHIICTCTSLSQVLAAGHRYHSPLGLRAQGAISARDAIIPPASYQMGQSTRS